MSLGPVNLSPERRFCNILVLQKHGNRGTLVVYSIGPLLLTHPDDGLL